MNYNFAIGIGDVLARPKFFGLVQHLGVLVGYNLVLTNTPERGEHIATLHEFSANEQITVHRTGADPSTVVARARGILARPKRYDPVLRNCQHTVNEIVKGVAESPLVRCAGLLGLIGLIYFTVRRR
jgi:hypothetical protein